MIELGKMQELVIERTVSFGVYLKSEGDKNGEGILLPQKQVPQGASVGDRVLVFVYKDSEDRVIATTKKPLLTLGELGALQVVDTTKIGAFLDWGLEKDLLLPFKEQRGEVRKGMQCLVSMYIDKSDRLCATMDIYKLLSSESPYNVEDRVKGIIYSIEKDKGAFVAVDYKYHGLVPVHELFGNYNVGDNVEARVTNVKEDGKLDLSLREKSYMQMDEDAEIVLSKIKQNGGFIKLNDNSSPKDIERELHMSKRAFKRAVGRLLKEDKIINTDMGIGTKIK